MPNPTMPKSNTSTTSSSSERNETVSISPSSSFDGGETVSISPSSSNLTTTDPAPHFLFPLADTSTGTLRTSDASTQTPRNLPTEDQLNIYLVRTPASRGTTGAVGLSTKLYADAEVNHILRNVLGQAGRAAAAGCAVIGVLWRALAHPASRLGFEAAEDRGGWLWVGVVGLLGLGVVARRVMDLCKRGEASERGEH
ncbi:hypothetical protein M011DRAFT_462923 [Sporormia fimetaria CBS 119925]|uniref:Uncharacterized protein n=1 Tax=Sporormia fimetaria CBS 119925 TaxID=1340428 RepID=A0A6A6UUP2_9PLEO|nr:hypothetical protein M011DRAFT_462923 [Sporormia fimetaria CBS 119925]